MMMMMMTCIQLIEQLQSIIEIVIVQSIVYMAEAGTTYRFYMLHQLQPCTCFFMHIILGSYM